MMMFFQIKRVIIPSTVSIIGTKCFSSCSNLEYIEVPSSVTYIGKDVFEDSPKVVIYGQAGSYAEKYAKDNNIKFIAE